VSEHTTSDDDAPLLKSSRRLSRKYGESSRNFRFSSLVPEAESDETIEQELPPTSKRPSASGHLEQLILAALEGDRCSS
jgi:hypothetical protein